MTLKFDLELDLLSEQQCNGIQDRQVKVRFYERLLLNDVQHASYSISTSSSSTARCGIKMHGQFASFSRIQSIHHDSECQISHRVTEKFDLRL